MILEDEEFYVCEKTYKPDEINLKGVFSLGYFILEQIFNLNGKSKFEEISSLEEKEKILMFFKNKLKHPEDTKDYHLQSLSIRYVDDEKLRKYTIPDQTIYLVDKVELDYNNLKSKDLIIRIMDPGYDSIIILKDGIIKSFDSLLKGNNNINFVPNFIWLYKLGSFIYEEIFDDLIYDNKFKDNEEMEDLIYATAFYIINGETKFSDKFMKFLEYNDETDKNKYMFYERIQDLVLIIIRNLNLSYMNQLDLAEGLIKNLKNYIKFLIKFEEDMIIIDKQDSENYSEILKERNRNDNETYKEDIKSLKLNN